MRLELLYSLSMNLTILSMNHLVFKMSFTYTAQEDVFKFVLSEQQKLLQVPSKQSFQLYLKVLKEKYFKCMTQYLFADCQWFYSQIISPIPSLNTHKEQSPTHNIVILPILAYWIKIRDISRSPFTRSHVNFAGFK